MNTRVYIAGTGVITAIGSNTATCLTALEAGRSGIGRAKHLDTSWRDKLPVGEVDLSNASLAAMTGMSEDLPRTALLSAVGVAECLEVVAGKIGPERIGFLSANTVGGMDVTERFMPAFLKDQEAGHTNDFINHECGAVTRLVARHFGLSKYITTVSTACSSSANSIMMAAQMIRAGMLDIAIAGGADALSRFTFNGFNSLGILDTEPCRPMDATRRGLNLGEGAGYVLLMNADLLDQLGITPIGMVTGWGNANDAYHQTASSPEGRGNVLAMKKALDVAGLVPGDISYINLHGTGTENNDSSEGKAVEQIFGGEVPPASSTKSYTGHTLGGAGGVEAVFSAMAIQNGLVFPNLRWKEQMPEVSFAPNIDLKRMEVKHVLSNSFGFGGACSSLIFSAC